MLSMSNYIFTVQINYQNPFQVKLEDYGYIYRDYLSNTTEFSNSFTSLDLTEGLGNELEDYYNGDFFTWSGIYPNVRGPGGGGYSSIEYLPNSPDFRFLNLATSDVITLYFDANKILATSSQGVKKVESDLKHIIESSFLNAVANKVEIYLDPIFTRDEGRKASNSETNNNGSLNPNYTPSGKTYSFPQTVDFELLKSYEISQSKEWLLSYLIKEIIPTPKKEETSIQSDSQSEVVAATSSIETKTDEEYVFNVEKPKTFTNAQFGDLTIVEKSEPQESNSTENQTDEEEFIFSPDGSGIESPDPEFTESEFRGTEEQLISFSDSDGPNLDIGIISSIKGEDPENPDSSLSTDSTPFPVSKDIDKNIKTIISAAKKAGITNKFAISAMLAISKKESGLAPRSESSYSKTPVSKIKQIFSVFRGMSDSNVDRIKVDAKKFFDKIYGGKYGNTNDEGFKYRGRGLNQITFKSNYISYADRTKHDILNNPDLLNDIEVAADCLASYFKRNFQKAPQAIKTRYNFTDINSFKNLTDATGAFYHANAGWGKSYEEIVADSTGGRKKSFNYVGSIYEKYNNIM
jgi:putative chitinase